MTTYKDGLLPCPFCGSPAEFGAVPYERKYAGDDDCRINHDHGGEFIQCTNSACSASSMLIFPTMDDAKPHLIEKWNRRAEAEQHHPDCPIRQTGLCECKRFEQPTPAPGMVMDKGPWHAGVTAVYSDDFTHDVHLRIHGDFADDNQREEYAKGLALMLNRAAQEAK
jgi:hypothetical protein